MGLFAPMKKEDELLSAISQNKISLEAAAKLIVSRAQEKSVLLLGESHYHEKSNYFIASILPELKKAGYTHFVAEVEIKYQRFFDDYLKGTITLEQLRNSVQVPHGNYTDFVVFEKCKELGIAIVCADYQEEGRPEGSSRLDFNATGRWTDDRMFRHIVSAVPSGAKLILNYGANHMKLQTPFKGRDSLGSLLNKNFGSGAYCVCFTTPNKQKVPVVRRQLKALGIGTDLLNAWKEECAVEARLLPPKFFYEDILSKMGTRDFDLMVNLKLK